MNLHKVFVFYSLFTLALPIPLTFGWSWDSADNALPSLREELDNEIKAYRQQVGNGMTTRERIVALDRLIGNYKPMGLNVGELENEQARLGLQEKQEELRVSKAQDEAALLYEKGVAETHDGDFSSAMDTMREAERLIPNDTTIKEMRRRLEGIVPIIEKETGQTMDGQLIRLAVVRYLENDPKRALNALIYAAEKNVDRPEILRLRRLIETNHPEIEPPHIPNGVSFVENKLQLTLEAIYEGRYLSAVNECTDVIDLEPRNVLAMTRLGSAYFAMNEREKARQIWTKALQVDPNNTELKRFLYGRKGAYSNANAR